ncbi:MAG: hypothetical protein ABIM19_04280 [candidate division WOR-3 bacterium]
MYGFLTCAIIAQSSWAKVYGDARAWQGVWCLVQTPDGGYILGTNSADGDGYATLVKTDANGNPQQIRKFWAFVPFTDIIPTADGGYIAVSPDKFDGGVFPEVVKLNASFNPQWIYSYEPLTTNAHSPWSVVRTPDGGYAIGGWGWYPGGQPFILKLNSTGGASWARYIYLDGEPNYTCSMISTSDGGYAMLGDHSSGAADVFLLKLSSTPSVQWAVSIGGPGYEELYFSSYNLIQTADGGYALVCYTDSYGAGSWDIMVVKLDGSGNLVWAKTYGGPGDDGPEGILQTSDYGYLVWGGTGSWGPGGGDLLVMRLDNSGNLIWARVFGEPGVLDVAYSAIQTSDGGYAIGGATGGSEAKALLLKLDANGNYPDCILDCQPSVTSVTPAVAPTTAEIYSANVYRYTDDAPTTINFTTIPMCTPLELEKQPSKNPEMRCAPIPGGLLFVSESKMIVDIYAPDGRLVRREQLKESQTRIPLDPGVYFWQAGPYKGKAVVK